MTVCRCTSLFLKKGSMARRGEGLVTGDFRTPDPLLRRRRSVQLSYGRTAESYSKASARTDIVSDELTVDAKRRRWM